MRGKSFLARIEPADITFAAVAASIAAFLAPALVFVIARSILEARSGCAAGSCELAAIGPVALSVAPAMLGTALITLWLRLRRKR